MRAVTRLLPPTTVVAHDGLALEVDPRTEIGFELWRGRPFEARERACASELFAAGGARRAIVDIGAHVGIHALGWARRFPEAVVVAVEPNAETRARLARNIARNRLVVTVLDCAVAARPGTARFYLASDDAYGGLSDSRRKSITATVEVALRTLDEIAADLHVPLGLVKIDVEGHEDAVIEGGCGCLARDRPVLVVEIYRGIASNPDPEGTVARVCELGYAAHTLGPRGLEPYTGHDDGRYNYVFLPRS